MSRKRQQPEQVKTLVDDEHIVDVGDSLRERPHDLDGFFDRRAFENRCVLRFHQPTSRVGRVLQQLLDACGERSWQSGEHGLRLLFRDGAEHVGGVVGVQLFDDPAELFDGHRVDDFAPCGWRDLGDDRGRG